MSGVRVSGAEYGVVRGDEAEVVRRQSVDFGDVAPVGDVAESFSLRVEAVERAVIREDPELPESVSLYPVEAVVGPFSMAVGSSGLESGETGPVEAVEPGPCGKPQTAVAVLRYVLGYSPRKAPLFEIVCELVFRGRSG